MKIDGWGGAKVPPCRLVVQREVVAGHDRGGGATAGRRDVLAVEVMALVSLVDEQQHQTHQQLQAAHQKHTSTRPHFVCVFLVFGVPALLILLFVFLGANDATVVCSLVARVYARACVCREYVPRIDGGTPGARVILSAYLSLRV